MATKRKRLVRGKDYDGWVYRGDDGTYGPAIQYVKPKWRCVQGKWVRVKFVEVT